MRTIGITGGVGAGKSQIMNYVEKHYNCEIMLADEIAHKVKEPGERCYGKLVELLGDNILRGDGSIDRGKMAAQIFGNEKLLAAVNSIVHPAVKEFILRKIEEERENGKRDFLFVEAALLIEEKYGEILDEIWYIYADDSCRRERLKNSRDYSEDKITQIFKNQLKEEEFRNYCNVVIDNGHSIEETYKQIDKKLEEYL